MKMDATIPENLHGFVAGIAASLDFGQTTMKRVIADLTPDQLNKVPAGLANNIATIVVHVCASEVSFAHRLKGVPVPDDLARKYLTGPHGDHLPVPVGETAESLKAKMEESRGMLLATLATMVDTDPEEELSWGKDRTATRRWILSLLPGHQSAHVGQMQMVKKLIQQG